MSQERSVIVHQRKPASNAGLTQLGKAFRVRAGENRTYEFAVFECRCGQRNVFRIGQVRSLKEMTCGCRRFSSPKKYCADISLMRMRAQTGINVEQSWTVPDDVAAIAALIASIGRCPCGMVLSLVDPAIGWIDGNVKWSWPETAERQQQTAALQRMAASGANRDELWAVESARIERARRKKINDHPVSATIIRTCPLCQANDIKVHCYRKYSRQYWCHCCGKAFYIRRPVE